MALSAGSCLRMSSDPPKMDSRYIHCLCTAMSNSIVSETTERERSHLSRSDRKAVAKREAFIVERRTALSSSAVYTSSTVFTLRNVPLYSVSSSGSSAKRRSILPIDCSIASSLAAALAIVPITST